jgi:hypothetical protein
LRADSSNVPPLSVDGPCSRRTIAPAGPRKTQQCSGPTPRARMRSVHPGADPIVHLGERICTSRPSGSSPPGPRTRSVIWPGSANSLLVRGKSVFAGPEPAGAKMVESAIYGDTHGAGGRGGVRRRIIPRRHLPCDRDPVKSSPASPIGNAVTAGRNCRQSGKTAAPGACFCRLSEGGKQ